MISSTSKSQTPLWTGLELAAATGGTWLSEDGESVVASGFSYRLKDIKTGYVALTTNPDQWSGERLEGVYPDATENLAELLAAGALAAIVHRVPESLPEKLALLLVDDTRKALDRLALASRQRFKGKVACITGSVGKTTTREIIRHALSKQGPTIATPTNWNHIRGVPATIAQTPRDYSFAIYEVAMPVRWKSLLARPHVAIITAVEPEHLEFFHTVEGIADEKIKILDGLMPGGTIVLNCDSQQHERLLFAAKRKNVGRIISYGTRPEADVRLISYQLRAKSSSVDAQLAGSTITYTVPLPGKHIILDTLGALAVIEALGADWRQAAQDISSLPALPRRLERTTISAPFGDIDFIDDSFSSNPASLKAGLEYLTYLQPTKGGRRIAVLGEMKELGLRSGEIHKELAHEVEQAGVDLVFTTGNDMRHLYGALSQTRRGLHSDDAAALLDAVFDELRAGDVLYIKGSRRGATFSRMVSRLKGLSDKNSLPKRNNPNLVAPHGKQYTDDDALPACALKPDFVFSTQGRRRLQLVLIANQGNVGIFQTMGHSTCDLIIAGSETPLVSPERAGFVAPWSSPGETLEGSLSPDQKNPAIKQLLGECLLERWSLKIAVVSAYLHPDEFGGQGTGKLLVQGNQSAQSMVAAIRNIKRADPSVFTICFPQWKSDGGPRSAQQALLADIVVEAGADLLVGHGVSTFREVEKRGNRWIFYSLGDSSCADLDREDGLPPTRVHSFAAKLVFEAKFDTVIGTILLYPIVAADSLGNARFGTVKERDEIREVLAMYSPTPLSFATHVSSGTDESGAYLKCDLGIVPAAKQPATGVQ